MKVRQLADEVGLREVIGTSDSHFVLLCWEVRGTAFPPASQVLMLRVAERPGENAAPSLALPVEPMG